MIQWSEVTWNELEPVLREVTQGLALTWEGWDYIARDSVEVAKDILNMLESKGYILVRVPVQL